MSLDLVTEAAAQFNTDAPVHAMHRDYHRGKHRWSFASPRFKAEFGWVLRSAMENLCPAVIAAHVDRLRIESWGADDTAAAAHGLPRLLNLVNTEAHVTGNAFAITWKTRGGEPKAVFHKADQVVPIVNEDEPDQLQALAKFWVARDGYARANVYDDHKVTRWVSTAKVQTVKLPDRTVPPTMADKAAGWRPYDVPDAPHEEGHDFGTVPAVWWKREAPSQHEPGVSLLRDMISPQDRLNKVNADMVISSERIALPIRYILNVASQMFEPRYNPETRMVEPPKPPLNEALNSILMTPESDGNQTAGQFNGPRADYLVTLKADLEGEIARITGVPTYYLAQQSGDVPSGESLRVVTSRLTSAVTTFQQDSTPAWRGQLQLLGFANPEVAWADPMPTDTNERLAQAEAKQRLGYALEDVVGGLAEPDAEGIVARAAEARRVQAEQVGNALAHGSFTGNGYTG